MLRFFVLLCLLPFMAQAAVKNQNPVEDLLYGNALYYFYLEKPIDALTLLAVNEAKNPEKTPELSALLLETLLKLDYEMALSAKVLIEKPDVSAALKQQDALWLHLANAFYQKQWFNLSAEALNRIEKPQRLGHEYATWLYLQAQLALKNNDAKAAAPFLKKLAKDSVYYGYVQYNVALHEYRANQSGAAIKRLDQLLKTLANTPTKELQQLQQRALISAAYISLFSEQATRAESYFGQLDTKSIFADEAIYGFGSAMMEREQYAAAIALWQKLQSYPHAHMLHIRAQSSLGLLHEQLDQLQKALSHFEQAERLSEAYIARLNQLATRYSAEALAEIFTDTDHADKRSNLIQEFTSLTDLLSSSDFNSQLNNISNLREIEAQLTLWQQQLEIMQNVSDSRIQHFQQKALIVAEQKTTFAAGVSQAQADIWREQIKHIEKNKDVFALNNAEENKLLALINRSERVVAQLADDPFLDEYQDNLRKVKGALLWQAHQHYHGRLWQVKSALQDLDRALARNKALSDEIDMQLNQQQHFAHLQNNVLLQAQKITAQQTALNLLKNEALQQLQKSFQQHIAAEQNATLKALKEARIAIARISEHFLDEHLP